MHVKETFIKFNDQVCEYDPDFQLYVFSQLTNPHFNPEV